MTEAPHRDTTMHMTMRMSTSKGNRSTSAARRAVAWCGAVRSSVHPHVRACDYVCLRMACELARACMCAMLAVVCRQDERTSAHFDRPYDRSSPASHLPSALAPTWPVSHLASGRSMDPAWSTGTRRSLCRGEPGLAGLTGAKNSRQGSSHKLNSHVPSLRC